MKRNLTVAVALLVFAFAVCAQNTTAYNSIPKTLPGNVMSEGPEAYAYSELGDGLSLASEGTLSQVTVVMSSWACQSGNWTGSFNGGPAICATAPGATFSQPITVKVYAVQGTATAPAPGALLGTVTETFDIPYRPSSTPAQCNNDGQKWYSKKDNTCYRGLAVPVMVNFSGLHIPVPTDDRIILTVSYNTTHYGPNPIGESTSCFGTAAGCPYDSLNISTDTTNGYFVGGPDLPPESAYSRLQEYPVT
jgi:hypothetical protein